QPLVVGAGGAGAGQGGQGRQRQGQGLQGFHRESPLRVRLSRNTARTTMTPVTSGCQFALIVNRFMKLSTSVRIKAPTRVPSIEPTPPNSEVPPISTAAIAGSVSVSPMSPSAEFRRARKIRLASPAIAPLSTYTSTRRRLTGTPDSAAASALAPIA